MPCWAEGRRAPISKSPALDRDRPARQRRPPLSQSAPGIRQREHEGNQPGGGEPISPPHLSGRMEAGLEGRAIPHARVAARLAGAPGIVERVPVPLGPRSPSPKYGLVDSADLSGHETRHLRRRSRHHSKSLPCFSRHARPGPAGRRLRTTSVRCLCAKAMFSHHKTRQNPLSAFFSQTHPVGG